MEEYYKIVAYILGGLLGVCVGSFLNVVIYRTPLGMRLDKPDSHCPKCGYKLRWYDNIPVISYLILGGKCRSCKDKISFRYTAVEIANMLAWLASVWLFWDVSIVFACVCALASSLLICVFFIDLEHMLVFDRFVLMLLALGVVAVFFDPHYGWLSHVIGGVVGFGALYGVHALFYYGFKKDALGGGDIKLTGAVGLLLGWERLLLAMLIASVSASIILLIVSRKQAKAELAADGAEVLPDVQETQNVETLAQTQEAKSAETLVQTQEVQEMQGAEVLPDAQETQSDAGVEILPQTQMEAKENVLSEEETDVESNEKEYPFAPFLCVGFWVALMFGATIIKAYLGLLGV